MGHDRVMSERRNATSHLMSALLDEVRA
jgi:hypothetical protein